jgi:hypothetical protein
VALAPRDLARSLRGHHLDPRARSSSIHSWVSMTDRRRGPRSWAAGASLSLLGSFAWSGCSTPAPPADADVLADARDGGADPDAADGADGGANFVRPPRDERGYGPVAPALDPEPLIVSQWMFAAPDPNAPDPVLAAIERGEFMVPTESGERFGLPWDPIEVGPDGVIPDAPRTVSYVAANVRVPAGRRVFARGDGALALWSDGAQQPGDVYGSGRMRVPMVTRAGADNPMIARVFGARGAPRVQLFQTSDELVINTEDATAPDLVVGDAAEQWFGVAVLNLREDAVSDVTARVEESADFAPTAVEYPSLSGGAVTQIAFRLQPKRTWSEPGRRVTVALRIESRALDWTYRREVTLGTVGSDTTWRRTFRSEVDGSAQYYGVVPPSRFDPTRAYGLVLALHGASVEGIGHARAYSRREWTYVIAPTNRRPYGFDWELWGRLDALEVLEHATRSFRIDPTRVHLTGHSMGGHGTWNIGVHFPGRFATINPSAGWSSFYTYTGARRPTGAFARAAAASDTNVYLPNLARRGAYVLHGTADDNVPIREPRALVPALRMHTMDVQFHEQPGAGHWWDGMDAPGADCVDWTALFTFMENRRLDPTELEFSFTTPSPWVNPRHSFVTISSALDAGADVSVRSTRDGESVTLETANVRALTLDGRALRARGVLRASVDGRMMEVPDGPLAIGPATGKRPGLHGPLDEVFYRPFCLVYPDDGPAAYRRYAAYLLSSWSLLGNGHGCALPASRLTPTLRGAYNLVHLGAPAAQVEAAGGALPLAWDRAAVTVGSNRFDASALAFVHPAASGRLSAVITATAGSEGLLFRLMPFTSSFVAPDYLVFGAMGARTAGFFTPEWTYRP